MPFLEHLEKVRPATTQATLLRGRGDLTSSKLCWQADLNNTSAVTVPRSPIQRLGFRLKQGASNMGLSVRGIADNHLGRDTPIVEYNERQEDRRQPIFKVKAGDRIRAVNTSEAYDEMLRELHQASVQERELSLSLERELPDLLEAPMRSLRPPTGSPPRGLSRSSSDSALTAGSRSLGSSQRLGLRQAGLCRSPDEPATPELSPCPSSSALSQASTREPTPSHVQAPERRRVRSGKCSWPGAQEPPLVVNSRSLLQASASLRLKGTVAA